MKKETKKLCVGVDCLIWRTGATRCQALCHTVPLNCVKQHGRCRVVRKKERRPPLLATLTSTAPPGFALHVCSSEHFCSFLQPCTIAYHLSYPRSVFVRQFTCLDFGTLESRDCGTKVEETPSRIRTDRLHGWVQSLSIGPLFGVAPPNSTCESATKDA
jgi:hypothetical protein